MKLTLYPLASDCRPTPRHPPLSLHFALWALLLCATFPVASEQLVVVSHAVPVINITTTDATIVNTGIEEEGNSALMLDDNALKQIQGRHLENAVHLEDNSSIAVILWDEIKSNRSSRNLHRQSDNSTNRQTNSVSYSRQ